MKRGGAVLSKDEFRRNFADNLEKLRVERDISQLKMADILGVSLGTYKRMVTYANQSISGYTLYSASSFFNVPMSALIGDMSEEIYLLKRFEKMSKQQKRFIKTVIDFETAVEGYPDQHTVKITLLTPNGEIYDGFTFESFSYDKVYIPKKDYDTYCNNLSCAIKLPNSFYAPTYIKDDILLVGRDRLPRINEIAIFMNDNKIYLRKLLYNRDTAVLEPVGKLGQKIEIPMKEFQKKWNVFGYVIKRIRY